MRTILLGFLLTSVAVLFSVPVALAAPVSAISVCDFSGDETVIDFEGLADRTWASRAYPGVAFHGLQTSIFADWVFENSDPGLVVAVNPGGGDVTIDFPYGVHRVGFDVYAPGDTLVMHAFAYDEEGLAYVGNQSFTIGLSDEFVGVEYPGGIDRLLIELGGNLVVFNDVRFEVIGGDSDRDGVADDGDNCRDRANPGQDDRDNDGIGDACDPSGDEIVIDFEALGEGMSASRAYPGVAFHGLFANLFAGILFENSDPGSIVVTNTVGGDVTIELPHVVPGVGFDAYATVDPIEVRVFVYDEEGLAYIDSQTFVIGTSDTHIRIEHPAGIDQLRIDFDDDTGGLIAINDFRFDVVDRDGDGIDTVDDNCPDVANPGQDDGDHDGVGDECDSWHDVCADDHGGVVPLYDRFGMHDDDEGISDWLDTGFAFFLHRGFDAHGFRVFADGLGVHRYFDDPGDTAVNVELPHGGDDLRHVIAPFWADLENVTVCMLHEPDRVTVQWIGVEKSSGAEVAFQMSLEGATGTITFVYGPEHDPDASNVASIGVEGYYSADGQSLGYHEPGAADPGAGHLLTPDDRWWASGYTHTVF